MNYDAFIDQWLGQAIDWDKMYGAQCVDEVAQYCADNGKPVAYANAKDWWQNPALADAFDFIANDPNDPNQLPNRGEIVIYSGWQPGSGYYEDGVYHDPAKGDGAGHIDIFDMPTGANTWQGLDQNWNGGYVHFVPNHTWTYVLGWLRPKTPPAPAIPAPTPVPDAASFPAPDVHPDPAPAANDPVIVPVHTVPTTTTVDPATNTPVVHSAPPVDRVGIFLKVIQFVLKLLRSFK